MKIVPQILSLTLTSKDGEEKEQDGIEEAEAHCQGVLMDDSRDDEDGEHSSCSEFLFGQLQGSEEGRVWVRGQEGSAGNVCL